MMFHSAVFILGFLPVSLAGFFALGRLSGPAWALRWVVAASLVFYGWWNPWHLPLLIGSIAANHAVACKIRRAAHARRWLAAGIALNLGVLGWFKYADFLLHAVAPGAPRLDIALPLAVSFLTFQQVMFLVGAYRDPADPVRPLHYAALVTFFPHLIAGPIVRPAEILPQLAATGLARPCRTNLADGLLTFLLGLAKKCVLADMFGGFADTGFAAAESGTGLSLFEAWYATLSYALQVYFDFSGYSDMATGVARMMNVRFPLNFDSPYQATDIAAFWRRWHMTLGAFLRDYLYIPLGGNRGGAARRAATLMATMLLAGLWHGAAWNFVAWGGLHGLFLAAHAQYRRRFRPMPPPLGQAITLLAVVAAWVPFRAASLHGALAVLGGMAGLHGVVLPRMIVAALPPLGAIAQPVSVLPSLGDARTLSFPEVTACLCLGWFIVLVLPNAQRMTAGALSVQAVLFAPHVAPFLYFRF
jgi:D-alanyl-lipoteichoic acid acyltransferase DltB (MBOAT superfamily)